MIQPDPVKHVFGRTISSVIISMSPLMILGIVLTLFSPTPVSGAEWNTGAVAEPIASPAVPPSSRRTSPQSSHNAARSGKNSDTYLLGFLSGENAFSGARKKPWLFNIGVMKWWPAFGITVQTKTGGTADSQIDFVDILGIPDRQQIFAANAQVLINFVEFNAGFWQLHTFNTTTLTQQVDYAGTTYTVGTDVKTDLMLDIYSGTMDFPLVPLNIIVPADLMHVRFGIGAMVFKGNGRVTDTSGGFSSQADDFVIIPMVSFRGRINPLAPFFGIRQLGIDFNVSGLAYMGAHVFDADVELDWQFNRFFSVAYGYKMLNGYAATDVFNVDFLVDGMFVRTEIVF